MSSLPVFTVQSFDAFRSDNSEYKQTAYFLISDVKRIEFV